jgi:DNA-binding IclR family transcriptional regulator
VHIGNADHFNYEKSYLVNLTGDGRKAEVLRRVLEEKLGVEAEIEVVTPKELEENLARIRERGYQYQEGTDLLFIFGKGFNLD